ncbi:cytochrome C assembly protein [Desulfuribacillus stibiiarsenatis]|uniref:Heme exporter protein C n=1 Tax=Desulfuribacillus stibiiarsenatis TaxID=1390249 RepID=A0A1E5L7I3_9FIRM|nr:cytochrome C assembly protein [Desulfuribacillus stibiiarsenatis]
MGNWHKILGWITFVLVSVSLYFIFIYTPEDVRLGVVQKIFYFHVASAWLAFFAFFVVFVTSIIFLLKRSRVYDVIAVASAEIGVLFTTIVLTTGPIWGRSSWNAWWSWEPRLTTTLILWFIYIAYIMIRVSDMEWEKKARLSAVFGIIGFIDVPIVFFSIKWWNSKLHPTVIKEGGGGLAPEMLFTLILSVITFTFLYFYLLQKGIAIGNMRNKVNEIKDKLKNAM